MSYITIAPDGTRYAQYGTTPGPFLTVRLPARHENIKRRLSKRERRSIMKRRRKLTKRNPAAKALAKPQYRARILPDKRERVRIKELEREQPMEAPSL
jgi:hypothetical protein